MDTETKKALHPGIIEALSDSEISERALHAQYDDMLDECYSFEKVGGVFELMSPSVVLREVDPTAYRCGFSDWMDGVSDQYVEINGSYHKRHELEEALDTLLEEAESALQELEEDEDADVDDTEEHHAVEVIRGFITSNL